MRRIARIALVGAAVVVATVTAPSPAGAAAIDASGWWWRVQTGQGLALPAPPNVPPGGVLVQGSPDGASAVAAVRYSLSPDESGPVLTLRFAEGGDTGAAEAVVLACPVAPGSNWSPGGAQRWDARPGDACATGQTVGVVTEDGTAMVFDLSSFAAPPVVDVILVAGIVEGRPAGADASVFNLAFEEPTATDLATVPAGAPVTSPPAAPRPPAPSEGAPAPGAGPATPSFRPSPPAATPSFRPPAQEVAPALPAQSPVRSSTTPRPAAATTTALSIDQTIERPPRGVAVVLLVVALGLGVGATLNQGRRDAVLAALGRVPPDRGDTGRPVGGIGRFARAREGAPPPLA